MSIRGWDEYVTEAHKKVDSRAFKLPIDGVDYVITYPTRQQIKAYQDAMRRLDTDGVAVALLGEEAGQKIVEMADQAPPNALDELLLDVLDHFKLLSDAEKNFLRDSFDSVWKDNPEEPSEPSPESSQKKPRTRSRRASSAVSSSSKSTAKRSSTTSSNEESTSTTTSEE